MATLLLTFVILETAQAQNWANSEFYRTRNRQLQPSQVDGRNVVLNGMLKGYALAKSIVYDNLYSETVNEEKRVIKNYTYDGGHPNGTGYKMMEPLVQNAIKNELKKNRLLQYIS